MLTHLSILVLLLIATGCVTERSARRAAGTAGASGPHIIWNGQLDQLYYVQWTPWQYDQWVDISGPLQFSTTNMSHPMPEPGANRIATECLP